MPGKKIFAEFCRIADGTPVAAGPATSEQDYRRACLETDLRDEAKTAHFELDRASVENLLRALLARFAAPEVVNRLLTPSRLRSAATHTCHSPNLYCSVTKDS
jgi:hypothetical protein